MNSTHSTHTTTDGPQTAYASGGPENARTDHANDQRTDDESSSGSGLTDTAKALASEGGDRLRRKAGEVQEVAAERARSAKRYVQDRTKEQVAERQRVVAGGLDDAAEALRSAGQTLRDRDDTRVAEYMDRGASRVRSAAEYLKQTDPGDLLDDGRALMRRYPELVFGGMFLAGLVAARFLKASERQRNAEADYVPRRSARSTYTSRHRATATGPAYAPSGRQSPVY